MPHILSLKIAKDLLKMLKICEEWLHSCSGCEIAILNIGEDLIGLLEELDLVHMPILTDHKFFGQKGQGSQMDIPQADIGIVSGAVANEEHVEVLELMREKCRILIALGTCATHGGIPALLNSWTMEEALDSIFHTWSTDDFQALPQDGVPAFLDRVYAVDERVKVDIMVPGCPPNPYHIYDVLTTLLKNETPVLPEKSVCDTCPTIRRGKGEVKKVRRFLENATYDPNEPIYNMHCLLEQGFMCMGPVTAAGCAHDGAPRCIFARVPCRGCFGPVRPDGNQMLDMMNALASNGIDWKSVVDRRGLLRFSGAHGLLRPLTKRS